MKLPEAIIIDGKECLDILCCKILIWEANSDVIEIVFTTDYYSIFYR